MRNAINAEDILAALPTEARQEFKNRLKSETGVEFTLGISKRQRKHRWASAKGHVVAIRFTDEQYAIVRDRAKDNGRSPGEYIKWQITRSHLKPKHSINKT
jgi:hypothetical protein